jgi:hypothetical protein
VRSAITTDEDAAALRFAAAGDDLPLEERANIMLNENVAVWLSAD